MAQLWLCHTVGWRRGRINHTSQGFAKVSAKRAGTRGGVSDDLDAETYLSNECTMVHDDLEISHRL